MNKPILSIREVADLLGFPGKNKTAKTLRMLRSMENRIGKKFIITGVSGFYKKKDKRDCRVYRYYVNRATLERLLSADNNIAVVDLVDQLRQEIKDLKYRLENLEQKE